MSSETSPPGEAASGTDTNAKDISVNCGDCGRGFKNNYYLKKHYRSGDNSCTGEECSYCERTDFVSEKGRKQHEAEEHKTGHKDEETLRELYYEREWGIRRIANHFGIADHTVSDWMERLGIETRSFQEATRAKCANYHTDTRGYETWRARSGESYLGCRVHRLVAVAEHGFDAVDGMVVHHKNEIPWDNRPENLEVLTDEEHKRHHAYKLLSDRDYTRDSPATTK